jgi:hypothetical protein
MGESNYSFNNSSGRLDQTAKRYGGRAPIAWYWSGIYIYIYIYVQKSFVTTSYSTVVNRG